MKIEQICVSLELAKKLKEAGYRQESLFGWVENLNGDFSLVGIRPDRNKQINKLMDWYSAPTASELGEALPSRIINKDEFGYLIIQKLQLSNRYNISYISMEELEISQAFIDKSEANARAKMWLYLKEKGLLN